ncbi:MAG TPA: hypothetical protein PLE38_01560, partial [Usitatibacteraceae bacterium]|nr:hypothetical protein [Usitatibacteraceae bacterium]
MKAFLAACAMALPLAAVPAAADLPPPPVAKKVPKALVKFGDRRIDDYFWLRGKEKPEVIAHLQAENAYAEAATAHLAPFREKLYKEMLSRIKETDESVPYRRHGWWYYAREVEGLQYPIYCRRKGTMEAPEEVMLDVNELAEGRAYTGVDFWEVSPDGNLL